MRCPESAQDSLYERTRKRKRWFESAEAMFRNLEHKPPFNTWRRDMLRDYCEYGTRPAPQGGVELKCPPEIEAEFYSRAREFPRPDADAQEPLAVAADVW